MGRICRKRSIQRFVAYGIDESKWTLINVQIIAVNKRDDKEFRGLLRSKGFVWLATRPALHGAWSQAGTMLTFQGGEQWFCTLDEGKEAGPLLTSANIVQINGLPAQKQRKAFSMTSKSRGATDDKNLS